MIYIGRGFKMGSNSWANLANHDFKPSSFKKYLLTVYQIKLNSHNWMIWMLNLLVSLIL